MNSIKIISEDKNLIEKYLESLDILEQKALIIAQDQLESSFILEKSIGFLKFKQEKEEKEKKEISENHHS
tara:strand:- start:15 stop:224 length:210 start_codon:yes stop_codon:yes gene_type:complete